MEENFNKKTITRIIYMVFSQHNTYKRAGIFKTGTRNIGDILQQYKNIH